MSAIKTYVERDVSWMYFNPDAESGGQIVSEWWKVTGSAKPTATSSPAR